jgi:predicted transcriptional regulator
MSITTNEFENFANFSRAKLEIEANELTLDDLVIEWQSYQNREEINAAIREGLDDAQAGRHRPADEVMADLQKKHGLSTK